MSASVDEYANDLTLTAVPGFRVGHAQDVAAATGCTVVLCPPETACAVDQRGGAPGTRETDALRPGRLVSEVHAVLLAGGSAFGLAAADGVMRYLEENGVGYPTRYARVPIVPTAVLYDLAVGSARVRPDAAMGHAACLAASDAPVPEGSVGAGTGCLVGSRGVERGSRGGIGSAALTLRSGVVVSALFAVNALGDVIDEQGRILAGLRRTPGSAEFSDTLAEWMEAEGAPSGDIGNTVIGVVATNARLAREQLGLVARMAHDGLARAVRPAHTLLDGDTIFALSAGKNDCDPSLVGALAAEATSRAIRRAVARAAPLP